MQVGEEEELTQSWKRSNKISSVGGFTNADNLSRVALDEHSEWAGRAFQTEMSKAITASTSPELDESEARQTIAMPAPDPDMRLDFKREVLSHMASGSTIRGLEEQDPFEASEQARVALNANKCVDGKCPGGRGRPRVGIDDVLSKMQTTRDECIAETIAALGESLLDDVRTVKDAMEVDLVKERKAITATQEKIKAIDMEELIVSDDAALDVKKNVNDVVKYIYQDMLPNLMELIVQFRTAFQPAVKGMDKKKKSASRAGGSSKFKVVLAQLK